MRYSNYLIIAVVALVSLAVFCIDSSAYEKKEEQKGVTWRNIKAVKPEKANIPKEYKELEKAYYQYWELFKKDKYKKAYSMESADYKKANPYKEKIYKKIIARNMKLTAVSALEVEKLNEKEVVVKGKYYYSIGAIKSVKRFKDRWVKEKSGWKHIPAKGQFKKQQS